MRCVFQTSMCVEDPTTQQEPLKDKTLEFHKSEVDIIIIGGACEPIVAAASMNTMTW